MNNRLPCPQWAEKLALRQEDLSPSDRTALQKHIAECPACEATAADYNVLLAQFRALPPSTVVQFLFEKNPIEIKNQVRSTPLALPLQSRKAASKLGPLVRSVPVRLMAGILFASLLLSSVLCPMLIGRNSYRNTRHLPIPLVPGSTAAKHAQTMTPEQYINQVMQRMTLDQKLGQLILVEYVGNNYQASGLQYMISQQYVGGFLYEKSNHNFDPPYNTVSSVKAFSQQAMKDAHIPLLIATDQEGGSVNRLSTFHGQLPSAQEMAASGNVDVVQKQGSEAAKWMEELGINTDLAPVVDIGTASQSIIELESRTFGQNPQIVTTYAGAFLNGLQSNGIAGCLKHFPGLGSASSDPHEGLPVITRDIATLENIDLAPYRSLIREDHPAMIMSTDILVRAIDPSLPAELSPKVINGLLRGQLGYNGVVISDNLYMAGVSNRWPLTQASVLSIIAGNDLVVGPFTPQQIAGVVTALKQAIQDGRLTLKQVNESVQRILLMKYQMGLFPNL